MTTVIDSTIDNNVCYSPYRNIGQTNSLKSKPPAYSETRPVASSSLAAPVATLPLINARASSKSASTEKVVYPDEKASLKAKDDSTKTDEIAK